MKKNFKSKKVLIIFLLVLLLIVGTTYAYIKITKEQKLENMVTTLCLDIALDEQVGSDINLEEAYPITDNDGKKLSPYTFTITNKCSTGINYQINLDILSDLDNKDTLQLEYIKSELDNEEPKILSNLVTTDKTNKDATTSKVLGVLELGGKKSVTHTLRLWLDENTSIENGSNKTFQSKVVISATSKNYSSNGDIELAVYLDGKSTSKMPSVGAYDVDVSCPGGTGTFDYDNWGVVVNEFTSGIKCDVNFKSRKYLSDYIIAQSETESTLEHIIQSKTVQTGSNATDEYRYSGESSKVNNWVCFGSEAIPCPEDNLYRIIGVIPTQKEINGKYENRVKLIKANFYNESESGLYSASTYGYHWNEGISNSWEQSTLQLKVLNGVYWQSLGEYQKFIDTTLWYLGAITYTNLGSYTPKSLYVVERQNLKGISGGATSYTNYVGLMYQSDYGYSIDKSLWDSKINSNTQSYKSDAWIYHGESGNDEWTINPEATYNQGISTYGATVGVITTAGLVYHRHTLYNSVIQFIRPTFNLKSNVLYKSGTGTSSNPYRIEIN